jgi:hypothetical protein
MDMRFLSHARRFLSEQPPNTVSLILDYINNPIMGYINWLADDQGPDTYDARITHTCLPQARDAYSAVTPTGPSSESRGRLADNQHRRGIRETPPTT